MQCPWAGILINSQLLETSAVVFIGFTAHLAYLEGAWRRIQALRQNPLEAFVVTPADFSQLQHNCANFLNMLSISQEHHFQCTAGEFLHCVRETAHRHLWRRVGNNTIDERRSTANRTVFPVCEDGINNMVRQVTQMPARNMQWVLRHTVTSAPADNYLPLRTYEDTGRRWLHNLGLLGATCPVALATLEHSARLRLQLATGQQQPLWAVDGRGATHPARCARDFEQQLANDAALRASFGIDYPGATLLGVMMGAPGTCQSLGQGRPVTDVVGRDPANVARVTNPPVLWLSEHQMADCLEEASDSDDLRNRLRAQIETTLGMNPTGGGD